MTPTPHDALVRAILGQPCHAAEELRALLPPEVVAELCLDTLAPVDGAFIDAALDESNADLLFTVALLHHGPRPWPGPPRFIETLGLDEAALEVLGRRLLDFEFAVDDLATQGDQQILARDCSRVVKLMLLALRNSRAHPRLHELIARECAAHRDELQRPEAVTAMTRIVRYVLEVDETPPATIWTALKAALRPETRSSVMPTAADVLRASVLQKVLINQIEIKFGTLDAATRSRIRSADSQHLHEWLRRLMTATTLAAVFEG